MKYLSTSYDVPDMVSSPTYIRNQVLALVESQLIMTAPAPPMESESLGAIDDEPEPELEPEPEAPSEPKGEKTPPPPDD